MYFAIYQSLADDERRPGLYREYPPDFFDLIVVDECHRGSARDESNWREILDYFAPAYQLGMTATPLREDNRDTYATSATRSTLTACAGHRRRLPCPLPRSPRRHAFDAAGWRPTPASWTATAGEIPDDEYQPRTSSRMVSLQARTEAIARHLTDFLKKTDRFAKTIVFCVDQEHADEMRRGAEQSQRRPRASRSGLRLPCRRRRGRHRPGTPEPFQDLETTTPVILTTSQMLTTGVDAPTCQNVVLARVVGSMTEFKQIIGRGTRVRDDNGKLFFNILDYTGIGHADIRRPGLRRRAGR